VKTPEELFQLSETDLEAIFEEKKAVFDRNKSKNHRIQAMLYRKIEQKRGTVDNLQGQIDKILTDNPELKEFLDDEEAGNHPEKLREEISNFKNLIEELDKEYKIVTEKVTILKETINLQKSNQTVLEEEVETLERNSGLFVSSKHEDGEGYELTQISLESDKISDELSILEHKIEIIRKQIHEG
jgi:predicted RNase H-like nuclease (RuvC/YqgF family)